MNKFPLNVVAILFRYTRLCAVISDSLNLYSCTSVFHVVCTWKARKQFPNSTMNPTFHKEVCLPCSAVYVELPVACRQPVVKIRWWQPSHSGPETDQWALDEVFIGHQAPLPVDQQNMEVVYIEMGLVLESEVSSYLSCRHTRVVS